MGKTMAIYVTEEIKKYIEDLAVALDRSESYIAEKLLEESIKLHKEGKFEL